jgi:3-phenylpropionate/trans-cinnamate dioxygenase ferredoxin component
VGWTKVASVAEIPVGGMKRVQIDDEDIALYHTEDGFYATSDICTHARVSLSEGTLCGDIVQCPKHGGKFNVKTGAAVAFPCVIPVETFPVEVRGEDIWIDF